MDPFLGTYEPLKVNQEDINNPNRSLTSNEIETLTKNLPKNKSPGQDGFIANF
jgi:hypothetical protein